MRASLASPGYRLRVVPGTNILSGSGVQLDDNRVLYVYAVGGIYDVIEIRRGWCPVGDLITKTNSITGDQRLCQADRPVFAARPCLSIVNGRLLMVIQFYGSSTDGDYGQGSLTGTVRHPGMASQGIQAFESFDDGDTWSALGSVSVDGSDFVNADGGNGAFPMRPGQIVSYNGKLWMSALAWGNFFGIRVPGTALYVSTNGGTSWAIAPGSPNAVGFYAEPSSTNLTVIGDRLYGVRGDTVSGAGDDFRVWYTTTADDTTFTFVNTVMDVKGRTAFQTDDGEFWSYEQIGLLRRYPSEWNGVATDSVFKITGIWETQEMPIVTDLLIPNLTVAFHRGYIDIIGPTSGWQIGSQAIG